MSFERKRQSKNVVDTSKLFNDSQQKSNNIPFLNTIAVDCDFILIYIKYLIEMLFIYFHDDYLNHLSSFFFC